MWLLAHLFYASAVTITKQLNSNVSIQPDNSILAPIRLVVNNSGSEPVTVAITDPLSTAFGSYIAGGSAATLNSGQYTVQTAPSFDGSCDSGSLTAGYTGDTGNVELATMTALDPAASCTIDFVYRFMPTSATTYNNQATLSGTGDFSATPLTDDDSIAIPYPRIAIAKRVNSSTTTNSDGTVTVPFQLLIKNTGGETLNNVDITDDISGASPQFGTYVAGGSGATLTAGQYTVQSVPAFNGACAGGSVSAGYTGDASGTVASINSFAVNASCTIDFSLRFYPQFPLPAGGYTNQALVSAGGAESGVSTNDLSDDGVNPDADNDGAGNEDGENDPTLVNAGFIPSIGLAKLKSAAEIIHANGTVTVPFRIKVQNYGDEPLVDVKVSDLVSGNAPAFGSFVTGGSSATLNQGEYTIETAPSIEGTCAVATLTSGFTGVTGTSQIASLTRLEIDQACEFNFTLRFKPQSPAPTGGYSNVATGEAKAELSSTAVTDISQDGVDPDSDSNDDPTDNNTPTPVSFTHTPTIGIAKVLQSGLLVNNDGSYTGSFRLVVENLGNETLNNVAINDVMNGAEPHFGTFVAGGCISYFARRSIHH